jgi:hypothetical protein
MSGQAGEGLASAGQAADRDFSESEADASTSRCKSEEPTASAQPLEWIEIRLIGEGDVPISGERYRVVLPDGRVVEGRLGPDGLARIDGVPGGRCKVSFPRMDQDAWEAAG